ncbi:MAG: Rpn family recombination-promoting nuclease/putative transposase [Planctomycetaceae bacterium]|jgi:predicted transposase YdaD|nr:Rpn family recombination-promoting nuclease/putative transposase [Planctomycetaceae bacterium]
MTYDFFQKISMRVELNHPHDTLSRRALCDEESFRCLLEIYGDPEIVGLIDLNSLRSESPVMVSDELREAVGDMNFSAQFKEKGHSSVFFMLEHQSTKILLFIIRCLRNLFIFFEQCISIPEQRISKEGKLPYPIIVLLYYGGNLWERILQIKDLISVPAGLDITNFLAIHFLKIDLSKIDRNNLQGTPVVIALLDALISCKRNDISNRIGRIIGYFEPAKNDIRVRGWIIAFISYILAVTENQNETVARAVLKLNIFNESEVNMMLNSTLGKVFTEGKIEGKEEGIIEGIKKGKIEGKIDDVLKILIRRFKDIPAPISRAVKMYTDLVALDSLMDRAIDCESLEDFERDLAHI